MFINPSKFEKLAKASYKSSGLKVGLTNNGMYIIEGTGWLIEVDEQKVKKEFLGKLVGLVGKLPEHGEFVEYKKDMDPQQKIERAAVLWNLIEIADNIDISKFSLRQNGNDYLICKSNSSIEILSELKYEIIDYKKLEDDESVPMGPVIANHMIIWYNDEMAIGLAAGLIRYKPEMEILKKMNVNYLIYDEIPSNEI